VIRNRFLLLALFFLPLVMRAQSPKPLWETNLSKFGYQGRPPAALQHLAHPSIDRFGGWIDQQGVSFTDPNIVVAYFVVHDQPPGAAEPREPLPSDPFRLVVVFLNANNGGLIKLLDWPLPANPDGISSSFFFPATQGRFVVAIGKTLKLYSPDFKLLAHFDSKSDLYPIASPSGESLLLYESDGQSTTQYQLLDTGNLSVLKSWSDAATVPPHAPETLWENELAWAQRSSLYLQAPGSATKELLANQGELCGEWRFIGRGGLAGPICGATNRLVTVSTQGKAGWQFDLGFEQLDGPVAASANGQRFAVPAFRWGSGRNNAPDQLTARVFSLESNAPLLTLSVPRDFGEGENYFFASYGDTRFGWGGLALSPEGQLLAVKSGASVQLYRVPGSGSAGQCPPNCDNQTDAASPPVPPPAATSALAPSAPGPSSQLFQRMLSWLPADTETVTAVTGPLPIPKLDQESDGTQSPAKSEHEVQDRFAQDALLLLLCSGKNLTVEPLLAAIEGSRNFRPPSGLGMMKYEGGLIVVFAGDITDRAHSYLRDSQPKIVRTEQLAGHQVAVFQTKSEEDLLTTYVAFPKPNIAVAATNEDYLREILARIDGKHGAPAFPDTLPEWKHVNTQARFWAVRHYQKIGSEKDPTSPFSGGFGTTPDHKAIGLTFSFDPEKSKTATITYLSGDENSLQRFQGTNFREPGPAVTQMHIQYREAEPGTLEGWYDVDQIESADYFVFTLEALLGHAIYL
jgi:hypothetical protein